MAYHKYKIKISSIMCKTCKDQINLFFGCDVCEGGKYFNGYKLTKIRGRWEPEHRVVMEKHIKRKLELGEIVHHIDHDRANNNIENLMLCKNSKEHRIANFPGDYNRSEDFRNYIRKDRTLDYSTWITEVQEN